MPSQRGCTAPPRHNSSLRLAIGVKSAIHRNYQRTPWTTKSFPPASRVRGTTYHHPFKPCCYCWVTYKVYCAFQPLRTDNQLRSQFDLQNITRTSNNLHCVSCSIMAGTQKEGITTTQGDAEVNEHKPNSPRAVFSHIVTSAAPT